MGSLQEILIDLILHESIQSITDSLRFRVSEFHLWLDLEVLCLIVLLKSFTLFHQKFSAISFVVSTSHCLSTTSTIRVIAVFEFVWVNKLSLVLVLTVWLNILFRKVALKSWIVGGMTTLLHTDNVITTSHSWRIISNCVVLHEILVINSQLLLVTTPR